MAPAPPVAMAPAPPVAMTPAPPVAMAPAPPVAMASAPRDRVDQRYYEAHTKSDMVKYGLIGNHNVCNDAGYDLIRTWSTTAVGRVRNSPFSGFWREALSESFLFNEATTSDTRTTTYLCRLKGTLTR